MKTVGLILAGGVGSRVGGNMQKQFILLNGKPLLFYSVDIFEKNDAIDDIFIVCAAERQQNIVKMCKDYNITKFRGVFDGGKTGLESVWSGIKNLNEYSDDDIVVIQDGNRGNTGDEIIRDGIVKCKKYGMAVSALAQPHVEIMSEKDKQILLDRDKIVEIHRPEFFRMKEIRRVMKLSEQKVFKSPTPTTIMIENGEHVNFCKGDSLNMKVTFPEDIELFRALLKLKEK